MVSSGLLHTVSLGEAEGELREHKEGVGTFFFSPVKGLNSKYF